MKRKIVNGVQSASSGASVVSTDEAGSARANASTSANGSKSKGKNDQSRADYVPDEFVQACFSNVLGGCIGGNDRKMARGQTFWMNDSDGGSSSSRGGASNETDETTHKADVALAQELNQLSVSERQDVYEDVHGISNRCKDETPELLRTSMRGVETELRKVPTTDERKKVYIKALFIRPSYFKSHLFILPFLRANEFDTKLTAQRILDHLLFRHELMGWDGVVATYLRYDEHLTPGAKRYVQTGRLQILPKPDRSGRPIILAFPKVQAPNYDYVDGILGYWWFFDAMRQLFDTRKGIVMVLYDSGIRFRSAQQEELVKKYYFNVDGLKAATRFLASTAIYISAFHCCFDNPKLAVPMATFQAVIGRRGRVRYRNHCASPMESMYTLMTFGLDMKNFPVDDDGNVLLDNFLKWLDQRRQSEAAERESDSRIIELSAEEVLASKSKKKAKKQTAKPEPARICRYPKARDVLLGRGRPFQEHPGNQELAVIVDGYWGAYQECNWKEKMELTIQIVEQVKGNGFRFLRKHERPADEEEGFHWIEVNDSKAREKVSHAFRNNTVQRKDAKSKDAKRLPTMQSPDASLNDEMDQLSPLPQQQQQSRQMNEAANIIPTLSPSQSGRVTPVMLQSPSIQTAEAQTQHFMATTRGKNAAEISPPLSPTRGSSPSCSSQNLSTTNVILEDQVQTISYMDQVNLNLNSVDLMTPNAFAMTTRPDPRMSIVSVQDLDALDILNDDVE